MRVEIGRVPRLERLADLPVHADPAIRGELLVERGAHERVRERVPAASARHLADESATASPRRARRTARRRVGPPALRRSRGRTSGRSPPPPRAPGSPSSERRESRRPTTSRMPSGMPSSPMPAAAVQRPSCCTIAPDSARWRSTSPTKNGLPSVSACRACARSSRVALEVVTRGRRHEAGRPRPRRGPAGRAGRRRAGARRSASTSESGWVRSRSVSR